MLYDHPLQINPNLFSHIQASFNHNLDDNTKDASRTTDNVDAMPTFPTFKARFWKTKRTIEKTFENASLRKKNPKYRRQ